MGFLRATGWGPIPLPGEKRRWAKAEKEARELMDKVYSQDKHTMYSMAREDIVDDDGVEPVDDEDFDEVLFEKLADLLTRSVIELKGPPPPLTLWSWHDIPDQIRELKRERDRLLEENKGLRGE